MPCAAFSGCLRLVEIQRYPTRSVFILAVRTRKTFHHQKDGINLIGRGCPTDQSDLTSLRMVSKTLRQILILTRVLFLIYNIILLLVGELVNYF